MPNNKDLVYRIWPFLFLLFVYIIFGLGVYAYYDKVNVMLLLNQNRSLFFDLYFKYITYLGNSLWLVLLCLLFLFKKPKPIFYWALSSFLLSSFIVVAIKKSFFIDHVRPVLFMERIGHQLNVVEGVIPRITYTFPSGHSTTAIVLGVLILFFIENRWYQFLLSLVVLTIPISRIYLAQHFLLDTIAGSLIALFSCFFCYYLILPKYNSNNKRSLIESFKNKRNKI